MEDNQIQIHAGECCALLHRSVQGILLSKEWLYFQSRCAETQRRTAARTSIAFFLMDKLYSQKSESCIPQEGRALPV